jgi:ABC-2 type transport system permease protein
MNFKRIAALIERDLRKFFRSPALMMVSMVLPLVQLIVLGYAFGGKVKGVKIAFVDLDHSVESRKVREMFNGIATGPQTFKVEEYDSVPQATHDLQTGLVRGLVVVPHDFSRRFYQKDRPRIAFTEDNTDQFISSAILERVQQMVEELNAPDVTPRLEGSVQLNTVEIYPYVEYIKYLLAGTIALSVFVVAINFRRAQYAVVFPFGRGLSDRSVPVVAEMDFSD